MSISRRIKKALRGDVSLHNLPLEAVRLKKAADRRKQERLEIREINNSPARLLSEFESLDESDLLTHFRQRTSPSIWNNNSDELKRISKLQSELFPEETARLIESANRIVADNSWSLMGFGELKFDSENFWRRDPLNGKEWGLEYHHDINPNQTDGSDVRVVWELNRFGHALYLARAFSITGDESFAEEFFSQIKSWRGQNPYGRGVNWSCAMEVALRAINLLAAFDTFRQSALLTGERLSEMLQLFDQHGKYISDNSEFSYISTSNHYLSDVAGLLWLGVFLPELQQAAEWKEFGLREMLGEMDKQILPDGADYESSTGYHRFVTELILYSFLLCKNNNLELPEKYWNKLRSMLWFIRGYSRPDGRAPLIGDADGGQILPIVKRDADDHAYLLALGAVIFNEPKFKNSAESVSQEVLWLMGEENLKIYQAIKKPSEPVASCSFPNAGAYILREGDLYLHFNANDCGLKGRGSHGHNDALSIEVSAFGQPFIVDSGSYVYNSDLDARQLFRSTAFHSTVQIDDAEQNTTEPDLPFVIGNEARPKLLSWQTTPERDFVSAEHFGYQRLKNPVKHQRSVEFNKREGYWLIEDKLAGTGEHKFNFCFHLAPNLRVNETDDDMIKISDKTNRHLFIRPFGLNVETEFKQVWVSRNYGEREKSLSVNWSLTSGLPFVARFLLVPMLINETEELQTDFIKRIANIGN